MLRQSLICIFLFCSFLALAQTDSKSILNRSISIQFSNTSLQASLRQLIRVSGIDFSYSTNLIPRELRINESF